jgi:hypothetical protein
VFYKEGKKAVARKFLTFFKFRYEMPKCFAPPLAKILPPTIVILLQHPSAGVKKQSLKGISLNRPSKNLRLSHLIRGLNL